ncbi:MAG TPA: hypothetical protein VKE51_41985 [Vicinamibacterales bacterium]|nr:hypothetical protein [Vicinamibacterales bacterium]
MQISWPDSRSGVIELRDVAAIEKAAIRAGPTTATPLPRRSAGVDTAAAAHSTVRSAISSAGYAGSASDPPVR